MCAQALDKYSENQKKAIAQTEGPLLIISGAGTGKTHLLTGKILYFLLEKGVAAEQILALTFTEKAALEMLQRVDDALPIGHSEVCIKTFHAFCDGVLRERGHEIGIDLDFEILEEVDLWMFLKRHFAEFKLDYFTSLGNPMKFLRVMQQYFSRLKDEDITPGAYVEYSKKILKNAEKKDDKEYAEKHLELANTYAKYEELLLKNSFMDYGGLMFYTIRLFEKRSSVLKEYQSRFNYVLVDEFQDTNFAQNKIVTMLANKTHNLAVVGDDDQAIYKWRGASLTNIQYFEKLFPSSAKVVLNENYRSSQAILDLAYKIIQRNNPNRLEIQQKVDKKLIAAKSTKKHYIPQIHHFNSIKDEVDFVISKANTLRARGADTAILVRTNALAVHFLEKLRHEHLPHQHFSPLNLFTKPGVKDCMAVLRVIADPWDNLALFRCLSLKFWKIPMESLLEITKKAKHLNRTLFEFLEGEHFELPKKIIAELTEHSRDHTVSEVTLKFIKESGYAKEAMENEDPNSVQIMEDIALFSSKITDFENTHEHKQVSDFLIYAQLSEEVGETLPPSELMDPESIKVLTIHGAKGLEFDAVFVPGLVQGKFPVVSRKDPFDIPTELIPEPLPPGDHHLEEERRLFYVAITRSRELLTLSYSDFYDGRKAWKPSTFIAEALESGKAINAEMKRKSRSTAGQTVLPLDSRSHRPILMKLPKLSYSQLDTFLTCPLKYQFRYLWNIETPTPDIMNFGATIHNTLKDFYSYLQKNPEEIKSDLSKLLLQFYEKNWIPYGYQSRQAHDYQKKAGAQLLAQFYEKEMKTPRIPAFLEKEFTLNIEDVVLTGRIDRIDRLEDGTYEVIDYKTGSSKKKNLKNDLQLSIYALACRDYLKIPVKSLSLYFLEDLEKMSTKRTDKDLSACQEEILKSAKDLKNSDFSPVPGFHCNYCDFRLICPVAAPVVR